MVLRLLVDSKKSIAYFTERVFFIELQWLAFDLLGAGELCTPPSFNYCEEITWFQSHIRATQELSMNVIGLK